MAEFRIVVLASGAGSNLQALIDGVHNPGMASIVLVASDNPQAGALERARQTGIDARALPAQSGEGSSAYHRRLAQAVFAAQPDLVVLAGYMRLVPPEFVDRFSPIINVHPSLLPAFPGLDAPAQALAFGAKVSGCTVHLVDAGMDTGPIIRQKAVEVLPADSAQSLHSRIQCWEHKLLVEVVTAFAQGRVKIQGRNISVEEDGNEG